MEFTRVITLEQIEDELRDRGVTNAEDPPSVFFSMHTGWWTTHADHLYKTSNDLPCDPRGAVLMQGNGLIFLESSRRNPEHYGRHGLLALEAAFHSNCIQSLRNPHPWCERPWDAYNDAVDRWQERMRELGWRAARGVRDNPGETIV